MVNRFRNNLLNNCALWFIWFEQSISKIFGDFVIGIGRYVNDEIVGFFKYQCIVQIYA